MVTTTFLELCNEVLLQVGERGASDFTPPASQKAKLAVRNSLDFCSRLHPWRFLHVTVPATTWINDIASLPAFQRVFSVYLPDYTQIRPINYRTLLDLATRSPLVSPPLYYSITGEDAIRLYPEPSEDDKPLVQFTLLLQITLPRLESDVLVLPQSFREIVSLRAQSALHITHTSDLASADACSRAFEVSTTMYRTLESRRLVGNMGGNR